MGHKKDVYTSEIKINFLYEDVFDVTSIMWCSSSHYIKERFNRYCSSLMMSSLRTNCGICPQEEEVFSTSLPRLGVSLATSY